MDIPLRVLLPLVVIYVMEGAWKGWAFFPVGSNIQKDPDTHTGKIWNSKISAICVTGLSSGQIWNPQWQFMEENKIFEKGDLYSFKAAPSALLCLTQSMQEQRGDLADVTRGQCWWQQQVGSAQHPLPSWVQMVFTTQQHDKGTSQETSHSMQWGCYLGWGDVGGDTALLHLTKINSGEVKKKTTSIWKEGGITQIKDMNFSSKTDC